MDSVPVVGCVPLTVNYFRRSHNQAAGRLAGDLGPSLETLVGVPLLHPPGPDSMGRAWSNLHFYDDDRLVYVHRVG